MLRGAPSAAGPTGTVGRARATPELHGAVQRGTIGGGPNRDHRPWTGRGGFASTHAHLGTAGRETILGIAGRTRARGPARPGAGNYAVARWQRVVRCHCPLCLAVSAAADAAHSSSRAQRMPSAVLCAVNAVPPRPAYAARGAAAILRDCFGRYPLSRSPSSFIA
jgi:hypothetical protein